MKKQIRLLFLFMVIMITASAQQFTFDNLRYIKTDKGLLIAGMDRTSGNILKVMLYDNNMKLIKEYSNSYPGTEKYGIGDLREINGNFSFLLACRGKCTDYYLKLDKDLKEIQSIASSSAEVKADYTENIQKGNFIFYPNIYASANALVNKNELNGGLYTTVSNQSQHLVLPEEYPMNQPQLFKPASPKPGEKALIRMSEALDSKYYQFYAKKWETELEEQNVTMSEIAALDDAGVFAVAMTGKDEKITGTFFYHLDPKTGKIKNKLLITPAETTTAFYFTKGYFDKEKQKMILVGNLLGSELKKKESFRVEKIAIFSYDLATRSLTESTTDLSDLSSFDYKPISFKEQFPIAREIRKNKNGGYNITVEIMAKRDAIGRIVPVGLSCFEYSGSGKCTSMGSFLYNVKEIAPLDGSQTYFKYHGTSKDGLNTLISIVYKKQHYTRLISFDSDAPRETNLMNASSGNDYDNDLTEILLNDREILTIQLIKKDTWEFKVHGF